MTAITNVSVASCHGETTDQVWEKVLHGARGPWTPGNADDGKAHYATTRTEPVTRVLNDRIRIQSDPITHLALYLSDQLLDAATPLDDAFETGVMLGNTLGGLTFGQREMGNLLAKGPHAVSPYQAFAWFYAVNTGQISIRHGVKGPSGTVVTEACSGLDAIGEAHHLVRHGQRRMIAGAVDGSTSPFAVAVQYAHPGAMAPYTDPDSFAPYCPATDGFVPAQGGALLMLESSESCARRGVEPMASVAGHAAGFCPRGAAADAVETLVTTIRRALDRAGLGPRDVGVVFGDGLGKVEQDAQEIAALRQVFGAAMVPVTVPKTGFGRMGGAGSATDAALAALCLRDGRIPPTPYAEGVVPPADLDVVVAPRPLESPVALVVSRGHGGYVSALVLRRAG